jgi:hypothetical protein
MGINFDINYTVVQYPKQVVKTLLDLIDKAYRAGMLSQYSKLIIFGIGAERGTYSQFANLHVQGMDFKEAIRSLTWFTDIYNVAQRNQGLTPKKKNYWLSQRQEIEPVMDVMGLREEYELEWNRIKDHDKALDLQKEWEENKRIEDYQSKSVIFSMPLIDREVEIMESVCSSMLHEAIPILSKHGITDPLAYLQSIYIEGTRGLSLGTSDFDILHKGESLLSQYKNVA